MKRKLLESIVRDLKELDAVKQDSFFTDTLNNIELTTAKKAFKIAVVGEFSTGKSTFINAMIGRDLLSHATQEVTATITNIHNVPRSDKRYRTCDVTCYDGSVIHLKDDRKLVEYTTTQSRERDVVQDIRYVDYYTDFMEEGADVVIVDTPGLNGMADGHRELTLEEVKQANYCIYLFGIRGMADTDKAVIRQLSHYQNRFIFVLNFIDQIKTSEGEDVREILEDIRCFLEEDVFLGQKDKEYRLFGVSSLKALASKDQNIKRLYQNDTRDIGRGERETLYEESDFKGFEEYLAGAINNTTIETLRLEQMQYLLEHFLEEVEEQLAQSQEQIEFLRTEAGKAEGVERLKRTLADFEEMAGKNKEKVVNYAVSECANIRREFSDYTRERLEAMKRQNMDSLQQFRNYEDLEDYINSGELNGRVKVQADEIYDYVEKNMVVCLGGVLNNILMRIQEYMKDAHMKKDGEQIRFQIGKIQSRQEAGIRSMEQGLLEMEAKKRETERTISSMSQDIKDRERELSNASGTYSRENQMLSEAERRKQNRLNSLGAQPDVKRDYYYTTEYYTTYEKRTGLIGFVASIFGGGVKEVRRSRQIRHETIDDSQRKAWQKQRSQIIESANVEINRYKSQVDAAQNRVRSLKAQLDRQKENQDRAQKDYQYYKNKLDADKKILEDLRKKANQELLEALKKNVHQQLERYLDDKDGAIATVVREYIDQVIRTNKKIIIEKTEHFYDQRFDQTRRVYLDQIEGRRQQAAARYGDYSEQLSRIRQMRGRLGHGGR